MPRRIVLALFIALLVPLFACAGSPCCEFCADQYQQEGEFPYFEVIRTRRLIPDTSVVTAEGWTRIFESCAQAERVNITASTDVAFVGRAFLQLTNLSTPDIDIEYRWLLDDVPIGATFRSRTGDRFPHADDINIVLPHVAAGRHRVAIEARVIGEGSVDLRLLFITAQGFPAARFPADSRIDSHSRTIGTDWSLAGPVLDLNSPEAARVYFQSYVEGSPGDAFDVRFVVDDTPQPPFHVVIPAGGGLPLWDHAADPIAAGAHMVRLEARAAATSRLTLEQVEAASAPVTLQNKTLPSLDATNSGSLGTEHQPLNCLVLSAGGDSGGTGGLGGTPVCGKYDLLIDAKLPAAPVDQFGLALDDYTIFGDGSIEIDNRSGTSGIATLTVEAIYEDSRAANCSTLIETANASCPGENACATADFTLVEFAVPPGRSQKFFYVDPIHWGSSFPNRIRVWARSGNCFGIPAVDVAYGRSRIGMQLVPAGAGACFSARDFGRAAAPTLTASMSGSKVLLQTQVAAPSSGLMDIVRAQGEGPFSLLARVPDTTRSFIDFTVRSGVMYRYQVRAVENSSNSQLPYSSVCGAPSAEVRITVPPIATRRRAVH
ncbi:MAG TPA: hypothetical protein VGQ21_21540 [Thermoanaerobaculia bacterium]|jgi:hypothetical protein|nr:hypothetical protein [Thermoanaerobaculia bacterium]